MKEIRTDSEPRFVTAFHGGGFWDELDYDPKRIQELGTTIIPADVLDAWYPPSPKVVETLQKNLEQMIHTCPPAQPIGLVRALSAVRGIPQKNILCGTGSSQLIFLLLQNLLQKNDKIMIFDPMYGEYWFVAEKVIGANVVIYTLNPEHKFAASIPELGSEIIKHRPSVVVLVNPNSPTGAVITETQIQELLRIIPSSTTVVLDETYIGYVGKQESSEQLVTSHPRLYVLKSMSKIYALSGLRIGYLVGPELIIKQLQSRIPPWSVSMPAQIAGIEALKDSQYYDQKIAETSLLRQNLFKDIQSIPRLTPFPSVTNFILCKLDGIKASSIIASLKKEKIFLRNCDSMSWQFHDDFIRITVMDKEANEKIINALHQTLS